MPFAAPSLTIRRLRAGARGGDPLATRRAWERALTASDAVPPGLGTEAILVLRKVTWRHPSSEFTSLRAMLEAARQHAVRPVREFTPANAEAVLFSDEAELLFCLTRDWLGAANSASWWWQALEIAPSAQAIAARWLAAPRAIPAAMRRLAKAGLAARFVEALETSSVVNLAEALAAEFALPALSELAQATHATEPPPGSELQCELPTDRAPSPHLSSLATAFVSAAVMLEANPARVRSDSFVALLHREARRGRSVQMERPVTPQTPPASDASSTLLNGEGTTDHTAPQSTLAVQTKDAAPPASVTHPTSEDVRENSHPETPAQSPSRRSQARTIPPEPTEEARERVVMEPHAIRSLSTSSEGTVQSSSIAAQTHIRSGFGGLFYLLNVALDLGIYCDFTQPRGFNLNLHPFDWLALLGVHWYGEKFQADCLHAQLASLVGRNAGQPPPLPSGVPEHWLGKEAARVLQRLEAGLPVSFATRLPGCVCRSSAGVRVASRRVDVHFELATHPLELRLSGLDRDPGWIPAAGFSLHFHYD